MSRLSNRFLASDYTKKRDFVKNREYKSGALASICHQYGNNELDFSFKISENSFRKSKTASEIK